VRNPPRLVWGGSVRSGPLWIDRAILSGLGLDKHGLSPAGHESGEHIPTRPQIIQQMSTTENPYVAGRIGLTHRFHRPYYY